MNNALKSHHRRRAGFTLVELMIVISIIALLGAIAVPNFLRARKRTQATRILNDLRVLEYAMDRWALEKNKIVGDRATIEDLRPYLKEETELYQTGKDLFGNDFGPEFFVDSAPKVAPETLNALLDVAPPSFWSPYN